MRVLCYIIRVIVAALDASWLDACRTKAGPSMQQIEQDASDPQVDARI